MIVIQDSSANYSATAQYVTPPVANGLQLLSFLNTSAAQCAKNYARNGCGPNGIVTSVTPPVYDSTGVTFPGTLTDYLQTGLQDSVELTLIGIANVPTYTTGRRSFILSNFGGTTLATSGLNGFSRGLYVDNYTSSIMVPGYDRSYVTAATPSASVELIASTSGISNGYGSTPYCLIGTISASDGVRQIQNMTLGTSGTATNNTNTIDMSSPYRAGSAVGGGTGGFGSPVRINAIMAYNRRLSTTERTTIYTWLKTLMSSLYGVTI